MALNNSSINNLFLLPRNFPDIEKFPEQFRLLQEKSCVYSELIHLEKKIQPILENLETGGLELSGEWFDSGLAGYRFELNKIKAEIHECVSMESPKIDDSTIESFLKMNSLPMACGIDKLQKYQDLHPLYKLLLRQKRHQQFVAQWGDKILQRAEPTPGGVVLKAKWQSYASYTGRITACKLPLTSIPKAMRDYIIQPDGCQTLSIDLNNAELRFLGYYSQCSAMLDQFNGQQDIHQLTGSLISEIVGSGGTCDTNLARTLGKQYAFSMLYGAGVTTIVKNFRKFLPTVTSADVSRITTAFHNAYPELQLFIDKRERSETLLTPYGEIRPLARFTPTQKRNFALQSSVAVAIKILMVVASQYFKVVHVVHDEIWIQAPIRGQPESSHLTEMVTAYEQQIQALFPGFPVKGLLKIGNIGGK